MQIEEAFSTHLCKTILFGLQLLMGQKRNIRKLSYNENGLNG